MSGDPVDLRVLQANERTLLAWLRTGLALMAFGFVVARMGVWLRSAEASSSSGAPSMWLGAALIALGTLSNASATVRYLAVRRAILEGRPIVSGNALVVTLGSGLVIVGAVLLAYVLG